MENSPLCLTGTAEVPLGAVYMDQILSEQQLPMKMAAFGHCFRTEAGAAGIGSNPSIFLAIFLSIWIRNRHVGQGLI